MDMDMDMDMDMHMVTVLLFSRLFKRSSHVCGSKL